MSKFGFYIKRLRVQKTQQKFAEVEFTKGLNVISGASDTGKTYIYQCIDYLLGSKDEPKEIPEASGYKKFFLEIETYKGELITIERVIGDKSVTVTEGGIEKTHQTLTEASQLLSVAKTQSRTESDSLPNYLLELSGFSNGALLKKSARNEKKELSFRDITPLIMVDEEKVISATPTFLSGQYVSTTKEKAVLKYVVSGSDDSELEEVEDPEIRRNKLKAKLEYIKELLEKLNLKINELEEEEYDIPKNVHGYEFLFGDVAKIENEIQTLSSDRADAIREKERLELEIASKRQLLERFLLLKDHYQSDLKRLDFITQGSDGLTKIEEKHCECVLCGSDLSTNKTVLNVEFLDALQSEKVKISLSLNDLTTSIENIESVTSEMITQRDSMKSMVSQLGEKIEKELLPLKEDLEEKVKILVKSERKQSKLKELRIHISERISERDSIQVDLITVESGASQGELPEKEIKSFAKVMQALLKKWFFIDKELVTIDLESYDTEIDSKKRKLYGKGKRSLITAANVISLMLYCTDKGLPHPGFVVIDTPLTPYKDSDSSDDKLADKVQNAFYEDLSEFKGDLQVIVIENKEPLKKLNTSINHIHFSGNKKVGRKAFIPT